MMWWSCSHLIWFCCCVILDEDDDEEIDRLTCWVCERAFRYIVTFFNSFENDYHSFVITTAVPPESLNVTKSANAISGELISFLNYLIISIRPAWFFGKTRQHTLCIHHTPDHTFSACFLYFPVFFLFCSLWWKRSMMGMPSSGISWWKCTASFQCSQRKSSTKCTPFL